MGHAPRARGRAAAYAVVAVGAGLAALAVVAPDGRDARGDDSAAAVVHAERAGLRLSTTALTGRVSLVASRPVTRWRIRGLTAWRPGAGRVLVRAFETRRVPDGTYRLDLVAQGGVTRQTLDVRNHTPLPRSPLANASAGLRTSATDGRAVVAAFARPSYRPGEIATIRVLSTHPRIRLELLHVGAGPRIVGNETLTGSVVLSREYTGAPRTIRVGIREWESGLYAARLTAGRRTGFAPVVIHPVRLGASRVAVVQPTNTWQAYNYRCSDGDGEPDTWYWSAQRTQVDVVRPYLDRGVPPHFRQYDAGFLEWLERTHRSVDMLAQEDIERLSGARLARLYSLIVFPGHHEYVTTAEYDAVERYRDLGGNLAFLSANNFFYRVDRRDGKLTRIGRWRDLGRPEAALVGVQYFRWNLGTYRARRYVVRGAERAGWLFRDTGLGNRDELGWWGIEVDGRTAASPSSTVVLASMPNAFGTGRAAEMTYYERGAARVFAAGAFTLGGSQARRWTTGMLLRNLWDRLAGVPARQVPR